MEGQKRLNILILSWRGPGHPNAGGAEISTHEHAKAWVKAGNNVTLFTSSYIGAKREEIIDGVKIIRQGSEVLGVHLKAFIWYLSSNHPEYDLIVDQFHGIPFFTPLYTKPKKLAFIHEVAKEVWSLNELVQPINYLVAFLGKSLEPLIFKLYKNTNFMTVSESTKKDLQEWGIKEKNIFVIHNGINIPQQISIEKELNKTLIYLGALTRDKGIERAIEVFSFVNKKVSGLHFWVVGKSEKQVLQKVKTKVIEAGLDDIVKFFGYVDEKKKFELLKRAHLLINTSIREGWGLVVIEAAAMGTPTIAFDVPGLRDSIINGKTGVINKDHSIQTMSSNVIDLLNDNSRYQDMKLEAVKWSKKFSWGDSVAESLNLINKIIKEAKS